MGEVAIDIVQRCLIHARKMDDEGWYTTANVLWLAADEIIRGRMHAQGQREGQAETPAAER